MADVLHQSWSTLRFSRKMSRVITARSDLQLREERDWQAVFWRQWFLHWCLPVGNLESCLLRHHMQSKLLYRGEPDSTLLSLNVQATECLAGNLASFALIPAFIFVRLFPSSTFKMYSKGAKNIQKKSEICSVLSLVSFQSSYTKEIHSIHKKKKKENHKWLSRTSTSWAQSTLICIW